jgi:hypothetical protein
MTELATRPAGQVGAFDPNDEHILAYLGLDPRKPQSHAVVAVAKRYDLDPVLKHVIVIPGGGVYITRDGLLHVARRSGQLDGIVVDQEPTVEGDEWVSRVSIWRKDMAHPFTFPGRYPVRGGRNKDYAPEMALKNAEAHALRRAFNVVGLPTEDELKPQTGPAVTAKVARKAPPKTIREAVSASQQARDTPETAQETAPRWDERIHVEARQDDDWHDPRLDVPEGQETLPVDDVRSPLAKAQAAAEEPM